MSPQITRWQGPGLEPPTFRSEVQRANHCTTAPPLPCVLLGNHKLLLQVREEIELANLANQYLRDMIKKECWDAMVVKGRSVDAFHLPLSVSNYPMKERTKAELEEIQYVTNQRKIEQAEAEASKNMLSGPTSARNTPIVGKRAA